MDGLWMVYGWFMDGLWMVHSINRIPVRMVYEDVDRFSFFVPLDDFFKGGLV